MFRLEGLLGQGGMGMVYAAQDLHLNRPVAIKVLHERFVNDVQITARFLREGRVMATLSSVHTVRVHMVGREPNGAPYIVMERVEGQPLAELIDSRGPLFWRVAVEYLRQMCLAIGEAHAHGITHRDVKPANVIVGSSPLGGPLVKVLDFGVAKEERGPTEGSGLTSVSSVLGTPEYMSPEQIRSTRTVDHRSDIWSLGATLFFMLTGTPPFEGESLPDLLTAIQHGPIPSLLERRPEAPPQLDAILSRCLHRDPSGRFATTTDLIQELEYLLAGHDDETFDTTVVIPHRADLFEDDEDDDDEDTERVPSQGPFPSEGSGATDRMPQPPVAPMSSSTFHPIPASVRVPPRPRWLGAVLWLVLGIVMGGALVGLVAFRLWRG